MDKTNLVAQDARPKRALTLNKRTLQTLTADEIDMVGGGSRTVGPGEGITRVDSCGCSFGCSIGCSPGC